MEHNAYNVLLNVYLVKMNILVVLVLEDTKDHLFYHHVVVKLVTINKKIPLTVYLVTTNVLPVIMGILVLPVLIDGTLHQTVKDLSFNFSL